MKTALALMLFIGTAAVADPQCAQLNGFVKTGRAPDLGLGAPDCGSSRGQNGAGAFHCAWVFPLRADAAARAFGSLHHVLISCGAVAGSKEEPAVNHPDSYAQRRFDYHTARISLALKEKSALRQSYLFLRVEKD